MARIPLPTRDTLADDALIERWDRLAARGPVLNVLRMFMANPAVALDAGRLWQASGLEPRARELVILRCAFVKRSTYEWHQHVRIARQVGLTDAEIRAVGDWQGATHYSEEERALLAWVDALAASDRPDDAAFAAFAAGRSPADIFGVTTLITTYFQLAHVMAALDLETEGPFVGWDLARS